jgi:hypothetical protein
MRAGSQHWPVLFFSLAKGNLSFSLLVAINLPRVFSASSGILWISKLVLYDSKEGIFEVARWHSYLRVLASGFDGAYNLLALNPSLLWHGLDRASTQTEDKLRDYTQTSNFYMKNTTFAVVMPCNVVPIHWSVGGTVLAAYTNSMALSPQANYTD